MYEICDLCSQPYSDELAETDGYRYGRCDDCEYRLREQAEDEWYDYEGHEKRPRRTS